MLDRLNKLAREVRRAAVPGASHGQILQVYADTAVGVELCTSAWIGILDGDRRLTCLAWTDAGGNLARVDAALAEVPLDPEIQHLLATGERLIAEAEGDGALSRFVMPEDSQLVFCPLQPVGHARGLLVLSPHASIVNTDLDSIADAMANTAAAALVYADHLLGTETSQTLRELSDAFIAGERTFRDLAESSRAIVVCTDPSGRVTFMNHHAQEFFGYPGDDIIARDIIGTLISDADADGRDAGAVIEGISGDPVACTNNEHESVTADGRRVWVSWIGRQLHDARSRATEILCVGTDVTALKSQREAESDLATRVQRQQSALVKLATSRALLSEDTAAAFAAITRAAAQAIDTTRVGIWLLDDTGTTLRCRSLFDTRTDVHSSGDTIEVSDFPTYFSQLRAGSAIDADDALNDPRTAEMAADYLLPNGIRSMLDATIRVRGDVAGVVCHEHVGEPRIWSPDEQLFTTAIADIVTRVIINAERRQAQNALLDSERHLRATFEQAAVGVCHVGTDRHFLRVNQRLCSMLGYEREQLMELSISDITYAGDRGPDAVQFERLLAGEIADYTLEKRYVRHDGTPIWIEATVSAVRDELGAVEYAIAIVQDVTARRTAEDALKLTQRAVDAAAMPILWTDANGRFTYSNEAARNALGYSAEELIGMHGADIDPDFPLPAWEEKMQALQERGEICFDTRHRRKDGSEFPVEVTITKLEIDGIEGSLNFVRDLTRQKQAEQELRDSEARFRALSEAASEGILVHDQGVIVDCNDAFARILGCSASELIGIDPFLLAAPESRPLMHEKVRRKHAEPYEIIGIRRDGTRFPVELEGRTMPFMGREARVVCVRDITQRKAAEEALRESEQRYRILAENSTDVIWLMDTDLRFRYVSPSVRRLRGIDPEDALGERLKDVLTPASAAIAQERLAHGLRGLAVAGKHPRAETLELEVRRSDGSTVWTEVTVTFIPASDTQEAQLIGVTRDISERVEADRERRRLATALEQGADAVIIASDDGTIQYVNPATETISGFDRSELLGRDLTALSGGADNRELDITSWDAARRARVWSHSLVHRRKDGSDYEIQATISPVRDAGGTITNYVLTARDVTEQAELERRLQQQQKMEAIGTLAGGVAHDFNNMLTAIVGYAELLQSGAHTDAEVEHAASVIARAASQASELTQQLLGFARRGRLQSIPFDANTTVDEVISLLARTIDKSITIVRERDTGLAIIQGDPTQVQQVLLNLGINARDAMPAGGTLTFSTRLIEPGDVALPAHPGVSARHYLALSVTDTGIGITEEDRTRVFEPFFTTKPEGAGTGMGLAMAYGIIEAHGGWIDLDTEVGVGTTFTIYIPLAQTPQATQTDDETIQPEHPVTGRILIVDDEETVREILADMLNRLGCDVIAASTGQQAVAIYGEQAHTIDAVIIDLIMPGMGGAQTFDMLREVNPELRAALSTGHSPDGIAQQLLDRGMVDILPKPYRMKDISRVLNSLCPDTSRQSHEARTTQRDRGRQ